MSVASCTSCFKPLPPGSRYVNCERCRARKNPGRKAGRIHKRDITYDLDKRTEREATLDEQFECAYCLQVTTLRDVRDRKHICFSGETADDDEP